MQLEGGWYPKIASARLSLEWRHALAGSLVWLFAASSLDVDNRHATRGGIRAGEGSGRKGGVAFRTDHTGGQKNSCRGLVQTNLDT